MRELICIVCPKGCHLKVDDDYAVTGNSCPRGAEYGYLEVTRPTRVVTSTVRCVNGALPRCPVKTNRPVPKELVFRVMEELNEVTLFCPLRAGDLVLENVAGSGADVVTTRDL